MTSNCHTLSSFGNYGMDNAWTSSSILQKVTFLQTNHTLHRYIHTLITFHIQAYPSNQVTYILLFQLSLDTCIQFQLQNPISFISQHVITIFYKSIRYQHVITVFLTSIDFKAPIFSTLATTCLILLKNVINPVESMTNLIYS